MSSQINFDNNLESYINEGYTNDKYDLVLKHTQAEPPKAEDYEVKSVNYLSLFRYSTIWEKYLIAVAILLAILSGSIPAIVNILYGEYSNMLIDRQYPKDGPSTNTSLLVYFGGGRILVNASRQARENALFEDARAWALGCISFTFFQFLFALLSIFLLSYTAYKQISRIKILFFQSTVCQDMAWFETRMDGNFAGKAFENFALTEKGIAELLSIFIYLLVIGISNIVSSIVEGWMLTLVLMVFFIPLLVSVILNAKFQSKLAAKEMMSYSKAGRIAEEVFAAIRVVSAFEGENKEVIRYASNLLESKHHGIKRGMAAGISNGLLWLIIYTSYAVAFAFGIRLIHQSEEENNNEYTPASLLIILFGILTGLTNMGFAIAHLETFSTACGAAASIFNVIKTKPDINPCLDAGEEANYCKGEIEFKNVYFEYPSRPNVQILKGLNLKIHAGEIVAIVGGSGAGKSTILQLVQRFYDPAQGDIFIDGKNIKSLKVSWLRKQLGVVGQEPQLFATTIRENIGYGSSTATDEDIIKAAREAYAHNFIIKLKEEYNTIVGQKGSNLSGGQKQRIAIARALIRNPKILLLDEATSALDVASEKIVQAALERASEGRTTLIITHRLSTIANADRIIVLSNGVVAEEGTHDELVKADGLYNELLRSEQKNVKDPINKGTLEPQQPVKTVYDETGYVLQGPRNRYSLLSTLSSRSSKSRFGNSSEKLDENEKVTLSEILKWNEPEWFFLIIGTLASVICGAALPVVCVLFGSLIGLLSLSDFHLIIHRTDIYAVILVAVGIVTGVCVFLQVYCFSIAGSGLIFRLRVKAFDCILHQEIGWFDDEKNKVGAICLRLSQDVSGVKGATGNRLGAILQAFSTMTLGSILSFFFNWKLTLVTLATIPFVFTGVFIESIFVRSPNKLESNYMEDASKIAVEVIANIKVVASLNKELFFIEKYALAIADGDKKENRLAWIRGFSFAIGQTAPFFGYALSLWYGGYLVATENLHYKYVIMVSELLIFGAWTLGQCVVFAPGFTAAKVAAGRLKYLFSRKSKVPDGNIVYSPFMAKKNDIIYSEVNFSYPSRPGTKVLNNFNLKINSGESIAIIGHSGSGKSTVIQLLLRFYDPSSGKITISNVPIMDYKISALRKTLGLVSQEPVLFDRTIEENIAYGDNSREIPMREIVKAAKAANIHSFIVSLPQGYATRMGAAGTQLSGGQKQRIAIARALVRNPQILLLDEATSALDPQNESIVQNALDKASSGRTTITIAHRLGAVKNAKIIHVVKDGTIKESGTHEELIKNKGLYYSMLGEEDTINDSNTEIVNKS